MKARCPTCGKVVSDRGEEERSHFPFCSRRCRMADLDRWFTEEYSVPGGPDGVGPEDLDPGDRGQG